MTTPALFKKGHFSVIAAMHLPPMLGSHHPQAKPMSEVVEFALRNAARAVNAGVKAICFQDLGDFPWAPSIQPYTIASMSVVGSALRREFPDLPLGLCMMSHGAREPLAVAQAIEAEFVRLKVYVGTMVKEEGILQGCAHEAIQYRAQMGYEKVAILADVYDRSGAPLARLPLVEEARQAAVFGRADALVLTGMKLEESVEMLSEVRAANLNTPLFLGGGAKPENIARIVNVADGVIVSSSFKSIGGWTQQAILAEWEQPLIAEFMQAVRQALQERK